MGLDHSTGILQDQHANLRPKWAGTTGPASRGPGKPPRASPTAVEYRRHRHSLLSETEVLPNSQLRIISVPKTTQKPLPAAKRKN